MESFFRTVAIGLGVLMGTLNPGIEPELEVVVHKVATTVIVQPLVLRGVSPKMEEALGEGVSMALTVQTEMDGRPIASVVQTLAYLPLSRQWQVTRQAEPARIFSARAEAEAAWVSLGEIPAGQMPSGPFTVEVSVTVSFPARPDWKPDMVWRTPSALWQKSFAASSEIPF